MESTIIDNKPPISHIIVVGFHHKLGCQVEFSYPSLIPGTSGKNECPSGWKYLPTLALPDGSHNFEDDSVFFNLPSLNDPTESVFGVSCYRQIPVEKLVNKTADVTRSTVQKSVCILSRLPIYGYIEVKLSLIADAFFDQGDFSETEILVKAYEQLNSCLLDEETLRPLRHIYIGLSLREIILQWRHKALILLKLFLLQRRVVCFGSPVRGMCALILGIASLVPRLLEKGFQEVACVRTSRPLSPMPDYTDSLQRDIAAARQQNNEDQANSLILNEETVSKSSEEKENSISLTASSTESGKTTPECKLNSNDQDEITDDGNTNSSSNSVTKRNHSLTRESSIDTLTSNLSTLSSINPDDYRAPISIFTSGNLCLPYLSLPYMDLLSDPSVHSYIIGTSNVLFRQKKQIADVLIEIESINLDIYDPELRRQVVLTTEDLRFMDYLLKHIQAPKENAEGSEHWIREQFQGYLLAMLRCATMNESPSAKELEHFNLSFMNAFKKTQCYQEWFDVKPEMEFFEMLPAGHPFAAGALSVADVKLKLAQTMQNSESGRKINQAVNNTSKAVGGAISQAKGAFTNWWSSITTPPLTNQRNPTERDQTLSENLTDTQKQSQNSNEITVTFQCNKTLGDNEVIAEEEGIAIVLFDGKESNSTNPTEISIDSADELKEEDSNEDVLSDSKVTKEQNCFLPGAINGYEVV